ncbi:MAG: glycosyltransferase, partial [Dysgonamonadaceae bacterium]|nr:glycosyltransferase [Dysgonamonadaceae bacterium]
MSENVFFSFLLPAYKAKYFRTAIQSILQQTYPHFELIIINDASPENLDEIVREFSDPRIRYYRNKQNLGQKNLVANWNLCLSYAQSDYVIMASDDDVYEKEFLSEINRLIIRYPDVDIYKARAKKIDENGRILEMDPHFASYSSQIEFMYNRRKGMISCVPNYIFRTSVLKEKGGFVDFPAAWHSDAATVDGMAQRGIAVTGEILFSFRSSTINISNQQNIQVVYDKLRATVLYDEWFEINIYFLPQNENEAFLVKKIKEQRRLDREYMCYFIV